MLANVVDMLFGCWHKHYTFPITRKGGTPSQPGGANATYVVCLDCGKEFAYDWNKMKVVSAVPQLVSSVPLGAEPGLGKVA